MNDSKSKRKITPSLSDSNIKPVKEFTQRLNELAQNFSFFNKYKSQNLNENKPSSQSSSYWTEFMKIFSSYQCLDVNDSVSQFIDAFLISRVFDNNNLGLAYQEFFTDCIHSLNRVPQIVTLIENNPKIITLCLERLIFSRIYDTSVRKLKKDRANLEFRLKLFHHQWINETHLLLPLKIMSSPTNVIKFCEAQSILREITNRRTPSSKLRTLSRCCRTLLSLLAESHLERPPSADEFFPLLVYTIIKTIPIDLLSTMDFINIYGRSNYLEIGEWAYYYTSLTCAVDFINKMNHESLNLTEADYIENVENSKSSVIKTIEEVNVKMAQLETKTKYLVDFTKSIQDQIKPNF